MHPADPAPTARFNSTATLDLDIRIVEATADVFDLPAPPRRATPWGRILLLSAILVLVGIASVFLHLRG